MTESIDKQRLEQAMDEIERQIRKARGEQIDTTPWDYKIPTGSDLKHLREECGLSRQEAGELIDYSEPYITNIETGHKAPGRKFIQKSILLYKQEWPR